MQFKDLPLQMTILFVVSHLEPAHLCCSNCADKCECGNEICKKDWLFEFIEQIDAVSPKTEFRKIDKKNFLETNKKLYVNNWLCSYLKSFQSLKLDKY